MLEENRQEKIFYQDDRVLVTSTRIVLDSTTFVLSNIGSVELRETSPNYNQNVALMVVGILLFCAGCGLLTSITGVVLIAGGLIIAGVGLYFLRQNVKEYRLQITTHGQINTILPTQDKSYAVTVAQNINNAIASKV